MKSEISWTIRLPDGIKRETRVRVTAHSLKWQFKRSDQEKWDYDSAPAAEDWDRLEDILVRRVARGRGVNRLPAVRKLREAAGA
jgi:hypothetical protein